jgi:DNA-binding SARP family transcriptional activator
MEHLRIYLFGGLEIHRGGDLLPAFATQKSEELFAFLVLNRERLVHRDVLCGRFWGGHPEAEARKSLRTTLWRIRSVLEPTKRERGKFLRAEGHLVGFAGTHATWIDVAEFEASVQVSAGETHTALEASDAARLANAAALHRGDFLEGHYDGWCLLQRERLRLYLLTALERLANHHHVSGRWLDAIAWGRQLLQADPLREHIHRMVMAAHLAMGDRPSALRQYLDCERLLRQELDIEPMSETQRLYQSIRENGAAEPRRGDAGRTEEHRTPSAPHRGLASEVEDALRDLYSLAERLESTRKALWFGEGQRGR